MDSTETIITFGSLFSGAGGLDLGLERAGLQCSFQVENDKHCLTILNKHWPDVPKNEIRPCMGLVGGDPCPIRSSISKVKGSRQPDFSGYFLAMVSRCKPQWVLRENVRSPDIVDFYCAMQLLGYHSVIVANNSEAFTGQSRNREFIVGFNTKETAERFKMVVERKVNKGPNQKSVFPKAAITCLTSRGKGRNSIHDTYLYEKQTRRIRVFTHTERESLQGWPSGWTSGVPHSARERMTGNGVTAPVAQWIGEIIKEVLQNGKG